MTATSLFFRPTPEVVAAIDARTDTGAGRPRKGAATRTAVINRDLARYHALLARAERRLREAWPEALWTLAMDALANSRYGGADTHVARYALLDALDEVGAAHGVEVDATRHAIETLTDTECAALVDAAERLMRDAQA